MKELLIRTLSGAFYVATIVVPLTVAPWLFPVFALLYMEGMLQEFYGISIGRGVLVPERVTAGFAAAAAFMLVWLHCSGHTVPLAFIPLAVTAILTVFLLRRERTLNAQFAYVFYGLAYVALPCVLAPLAVYPDGRFFGLNLLSLFCIVWCSDVGAYAVGTLLGQKAGSKKLAPSISPKKSWWGVAGAVVFGVAGAFVLCRTALFLVPAVHALVLGFLVSVLSVMGDLVESLWKRHFGVKDSGSILPGHGGFLDRLDSAIFAFPAVLAYLAAFNLL